MRSQLNQQFNRVQNNQNQRLVKHKNSSFYQRQSRLNYSSNSGSHFIIHKNTSLSQQLNSTHSTHSLKGKIVNTAVLTAEKLSVQGGKHALQTGYYKLQSSITTPLRNSANDDMSRVAISSFKLLHDSGQGLVNSYKSIKTLAEEKQKYNRLYNSISSIREKNLQTLYKKKESYKLNNLVKKRLKKYENAVNRVNKANDKILNNQFKITALSVLNIPNPVGYAKQQALQKARFKAIQQADDNDAVKALNTVLTVAKKYKPSVRKEISRLKRKQKTLRIKAAKKQAKLKLQDSKLSHNASSSNNSTLKNKIEDSDKKQKAENKFQKAKNKFKKHIKKKKAATLSTKASETALKAAIKPKTLLIIKLILAAIIIFVLLALCLVCCVAGTGTATAIAVNTYTASDVNLSKAAECYTNIGYSFNQKIMAIQSDWRKGLEDLGIDASKSRYEEEPTKFIFGQSSVFPDPPVYDNDTSKIYAFLTALNVNYHDNSLQLWEFDSHIERALLILYKKQYQFVYKYVNNSRWETLQSFNFYGGNGVSGTYYRADKNNVYKNKVKLISCPGEIQKFQKEGFIYFNDELEILDPYNKNKVTGYYIKDQRYIVTDPLGYSNMPFYKYDTTTHKYGWYYNDEWQDRGYWGFNRRDQIYYTVSPQDTVMWNSTLSDSALISFYQAKEWVTDCYLYYSVKQKMSLEDAILEILMTTENGEDRVKHYKQLVYGDDEMEPLGGNHQVMTSPIKDMSYSDIINTHRIYNDYAYDIQEWNDYHCSIEYHDGIDISADTGSAVCAAMDGKIVHCSDNTIALVGNANLITDGNNSTSFHLTYDNVKIARNIRIGQTVKKGQFLGTLLRNKMCGSIYNDKADRAYLHFSVYEYIDDNWISIDPKLLISLTNEDQEE